MYIVVTVTPRARRAHVERIDETHLRVAVAAVPRAGRANDAVIAALAEYFHVPPSRVRIVRGQTNRHKVVEIAQAPE